MTEKAKGHVITGLCVFAAAAIFFSIGTRHASYSSPDEKRYVQSAEEMVSGGDWVTPRYHGRPRFQKPIFFYWLAASSIALFGKGWMAARAPSVLFGALTVLLTYLLGTSIYNRRTGLLSAGLLGTSWIFFLYSRLATPDMAFLFFTALSVFAFARAYFNGAVRGAWVLAFAAAAFAFLTKGAAGLLVSLATVAAFYASNRKGGLLSGRAIALGAALFLAIALPWFVIMYKVHGEVYLNHVWQVETVGRAGGLCGAGGCIFISLCLNILRYIGVTLLVFLPASLFLPQALIDRTGRGAEAGRFIFTWIGVVILFFSMIGAKKSHYALMLAPPLANLIGGYLSSIVDEARAQAAFFVPYALAMSAAALCAAGVFLARDIFGIEGAFLWTALIAIGPAASVVAAKKRNTRGGPAIFIATVALILAFVFGALLPGLAAHDGLYALSQEILSARKAGEEIGVGSHFISHNRLDYYLGLNVKKVNVDMSDRKEQIAASRMMLDNFFKAHERKFCVIIREDYEEYLTAASKRRLHILGKGWYWKKPNQLDIGPTLAGYILQNDKAAFDRAVKNEIYLISNMP